MFREAGTQFSPATTSQPSPRTASPPCLPLGIKDSLKEDVGVFLWCFLLWAFWLRIFLLAFWILMWEALEGKRIVEGKRIAEGGLLKGNCQGGIAKEGLIESLHQELYT
jgi:hypothetical protein